jgi:hypothetical protein
MAEKGLKMHGLRTLAGCALVALLAIASPVLAYDAPPIRFAPGKSQATASGGVVRGERNVYKLTARAGQRLSLSITSLEDNAAFTVYAPGAAYSTDADGAVDVSGKVIAGKGDGIATWAGKLPKTGQYLIVVGGTRGNADYKLTVSVTGR